MATTRAAMHFVVLAQNDTPCIRLPVSATCETW